MDRKKRSIWSLSTRPERAYAMPMQTLCAHQGECIWSESRHSATMTLLRNTLIGRTVRDVSTRPTLLPLLYGPHGLRAGGLVVVPGGFARKEHHVQHHRSNRPPAS
jgi:hypothetical protein